MNYFHQVPVTLHTVFQRKCNLDLQFSSHVIIDATSSLKIKFLLCISCFTTSEWLITHTRLLDSPGVISGSLTKHQALYESNNTVDFPDSGHSRFILNVGTGLSGYVATYPRIREFALTTVRSHNLKILTRHLITKTCISILLVA
jgi:hypothetical protein